MSVIESVARPVGLVTLRGGTGGGRGFPQFFENDIVESNPCEGSNDVRIYESSPYSQNKYNVVVILLLT